MSFLQPAEPVVDYVRRRVAAFRKNGPFNIQIDIRWMLAVKSIITTKTMAQRHLVRLVYHSSIAPYLGDDTLLVEANTLVVQSGRWFRTFNDRQYIAPELSASNIAACNRAIGGLLPDLPRLCDQEVAAAIHEDAQELLHNVPANGASQGMQPANCIRLTRPESDMRSEVFELVEKLSAVQRATAFSPGRHIASAHQTLQSQALKN